jgi:diguanylate cyclase (GGDEF)-like protein/PAS domain S-box-containing protein
MALDRLAARLPQRQRLLRNAAAGLLLACHLVLIGVLLWFDTDAWPVILLLSLSSCGLAALLCVSLRRLERAESRPRHDALTRWIDQIDVASDALPSLPSTLQGQDLYLAHANQRLAARLHKYRGNLQIRHQRVQRLLRNVTDVLYHTDQDACLTWITDSVFDTLGYDPDELRGLPLARLLVSPDTDLPILTRSPSLTRHPTRMFHKGGSISWMSISVRGIEDSRGEVIGTEGICRDITRLIDVQQQLDQERERAQTTLSAIADGVITTDTNGIIDYINSSGLEMLSIAPQHGLNRPFERTCHLFDPETKAFVHDLVEKGLETGTSRAWPSVLALVGDRETKPKDNQDHRWVTVFVSIMRDKQNRIHGTVVVLHDVTQLQRASRELTHQANHDSLTGLLNRRALVRRLEHLCASIRPGKTMHTLCYLDFDHFKLVNDTYGHQAGDALLRQLSSQLSVRLRSHDTLARLGGDEFAIIFHDTDLDTARNIAERLCEWLRCFHFEWGDDDFHLGASLGLCPIYEGSISATELLRRADTACYWAKEQGRNRVRVFYPDSDEGEKHGDQIGYVQMIAKALAGENFMLYAQPIVPLSADGNHTPPAVELLLRTNSDSKLVSTQDVLLVAERYNMASRIDRWVFQEALRLIEQLGNDGQAVEYYSINVSGQSISDERFVDFVHERIEHSGVDPAQLVFEITETAAVLNPGLAAELMQSLRVIGLRFALDDFGTGLSSISYLKSLPSDFLKIDGSLVRDVAEDPSDRAIIEGLCKIGKAVGLRTVGEQVETEAQIDMLKQLGIDYAQGYYVARPMPFSSFAAQLNDRSWHIQEGT